MSGVAEIHPGDTVDVAVAVNVPDVDALAAFDDQRAAFLAEHGVVVHADEYVVEGGLPEFGGAFDGAGGRSCRLHVSGLYGVSKKDESDSIASTISSHETLREDRCRHRLFGGHRRVPRLRRDLVVGLLYLARLPRPLVAIRRHLHHRPDIFHGGRCNRSGLSAEVVRDVSH